MLSKIISCGLFLLMSIPTFSQVHEKDLEELFSDIKAKDSLVFNLGYNNCDTAQLRLLLCEDFEFYHDQNGIVDSKKMFLRNIPNLCSMNYKATRKLLNERMEVFPLYNNGEIYGAIQTGLHEFYAKETGLPKYLTSTSKFTHLWLLIDGDWQLKRILSYDHQVPENRSRD